MITLLNHATKVSTHSRLKAAGMDGQAEKIKELVSTHSRLKAAGGRLKNFQAAYGVSTHSRLKAAGYIFFF